MTYPFLFRFRPAALAVAGTLACALFAVPAESVQARPPAAAVAPVPAQLAQAVAALRAISTLRADFTQTDRVGQRLTGTLFLKRPGRIRFQYAKGVPMLIVGDGKALTFIDSEVKQSQRWPISNSPLGALLDPSRDVSRFGTLIPTGDPDVISVEVRDRGHPEYGVINLIFLRDAAAPGGLQLASWVAVDAQNQRTTIRLSNQRYGMPLDDGLFRFLDTRSRPHP